MSEEAARSGQPTVDPLTVRPIRLPRPVAPDADWATLRDRILAACGAPAPGWSDQSAVDPGTTLAEAAAFALADLHHRTGHRLPVWPVEVPAWLPEEERHWYATLPPGASGALADRLRAPAPENAGTGSTAAVLEREVRRCGSPDQAAALFVRAPWAGVFDAAQVPVVIALLRARLVRATAHEFTGPVADAVEQQRGTGGTVAERDARAAAALEQVLPLWPGEVAALVRRERRRRGVATVLDRLSEVVAATPGTAAAVRARLSAAPYELTPGEVDAAMAAARTPPGTTPEDLERADGETRLWPPHPVQALTCEPVTADDYARRARAHGEVGRAWAVPGRLPGIGWDGRKTTEAEDRAGTVTLVVERAASTGSVERFLREVLATAIGSEVVQPHPTWSDDLDALDPRRVIGDEVGAALLREVPVAVRGWLVADVGADYAELVRRAEARLTALFTRGPESRRPESRGTAGPRERTPGAAGAVEVDGPWPREDQPQDGWTPGDPIRFSDVVETLADDAEVLGVEDLAIGVDGAPPVAFSAGAVLVPASTVPVPTEPAAVPETAGEEPSRAGWVPVPADAVPGRTDVSCLRVRLVPTAGCGHG
ncbi:hypothetical protein [Streptomyces justiciae]|uniref:DUF222 domain-containing protein n=1 Tax=Streptomyces justiciae TaxID=2780140 RepID=A0ABU3M0B4_9ACTN|nr:hypothetical protein [Streptomyces justiciae]MDT7844926.1 hypothetical protein [Streptomyces justiciae]